MTLKFIEVTRQSPWQHVADATTLLIEQMKAIKVVVVDRHVKMAIENILKPGSSAHIFLCYDNDDKAAGCCVFNIGSGIEAGGDYIWINEFHVREDMRRQGIGKELLRQVMLWTEEKGYSYIAAVTSPENKAARELFRKQGFDISETMWVMKTG